ncbi:hypothetical protein A6A40_19015 (plasmid) [Azospirillum humicireducens]|uniref:TRAP C4-dicarboxylate transport system permease DctM subunit domain-containing protein n=1 Tax=Azospirillum humicireducens TaxID=1226968 RepID=A0A2R4VTJ0_9PROT|nr:hypothetical protein A6A40_19015 [Azospirillum humicireducens]
MVMLLVGAAMVAAGPITVVQLPQQLAVLLGPLVDHPQVPMVGMVMDLSPTTLILVPLSMPIVKMAGIDPVRF